MFYVANPDIIITFSAKIELYPGMEIVLGSSPPTFFQGEALPRMSSPLGMCTVDSYICIYVWNLGPRETCPPKTEFAHSCLILPSPL